MSIDKGLHQKIMSAAYDRWQTNAWSKTEFWAQLSPTERFAVATGNLNYQVCNGGFSQWIFNGYATKESLALLCGLDVIATAAACAVAEIVRKASDVIGTDYRGEDFDEDDHEAISALDDAFYAVNDAFMTECEAHLVGLDAKNAPVSDLETRLWAILDKDGLRAVPSDIVDAVSRVCAALDRVTAERDAAVAARDAS